MKVEEIKKYLLENFTMKNGEIKKKGTRKVLSDIEVSKELMLYAEDNDKEWNKNDRTSAITLFKQEIKEKANAPKEDPVTLFIAQAFIDNEIILSPVGDFYKSGIILEEYEVLTILQSDMFDWNRDNPDHYIQATELKSKIEKMKFEKYFQIKENLINSLKYSKDNEKDLEEYLELIYKTFQFKQSFEYFKIMFSHWLWIVKRRLSGKSSAYQFLLNFYGKSATGKSTFVNILTKPFSDFRVMNASIESIIDERSTPALAKNYIHFIDELKTSKTVWLDSDLGPLKDIITLEEKREYRVMTTNAGMKVIPRTTLISCSNFHLHEVLNDSQSMRRFFELEIGIESNGYDENNFKRIEELNLNAWKGINENLDLGYHDVRSDIGKEIWEYQDSFRRKTAFDMWLNSVEITSGKSLGAEVYESYQEYCRFEHLEHKMKSPQLFYSAIRSLGYDTFIGHGGKSYISADFKRKEENISKQSDADFLKSLDGVKQVTTNKLIGIE